MLEGSDISNDHCLLFKFGNDGNKISSGFKGWLVNTELDVQDVIEKETTVKVNWPTNVNVSESNKMRKLIKKTTKWQKFPVKILAEGSKKKIPIF